VSTFKIFSPSPSGTPFCFRGFLRGVCCFSLGSGESKEIQVRARHCWYGCERRFFQEKKKMVVCAVRCARTAPAPYLRQVQQRTSAPRPLPDLQIGLACLGREKSP